MMHESKNKGTVSKEQGGTGSNNWTSLGVDKVGSVKKPPLQIPPKEDSTSSENEKTEPERQGGGVQEFDLRGWTVFDPPFF